MILSCVKMVISINPDKNQIKTAKPPLWAWNTGKNRIFVAKAAAPFFYTNF